MDSFPQARLVECIYEGISISCRPSCSYNRRRTRSSEHTGAEQQAKAAEEQVRREAAEAEVARQVRKETAEAEAARIDLQQTSREDLIAAMASGKVDALEQQLWYEIN
jgi:predicted  nucleic acid-binding Zn-ribbon protein